MDTQWLDYYTSLQWVGRCDFYVSFKVKFNPAAYKKLKLNMTQKGIETIAIYHEYFVPLLSKIYSVSIQYLKTYILNKVKLLLKSPFRFLKQQDVCINRLNI